MEENKQIKISLKLAIIIAIIIILLISSIGIGIYITKNNSNIADNEHEIEKINDSSQEDYEKVDIDGKTYYHRLTNNKWNGEYHQDTYYTSQENDKEEVVSYKDYIKYINEIKTSDGEKIESYYTDKTSNYIILSYSNGYSMCNMELIDCKEEKKQIIIYGDENVRGRSEERRVGKECRL